MVFQFLVEELEASLQVKKTNIENIDNKKSMSTFKCINVKIFDFDYTDSSTPHSRASPTAVRRLNKSKRVNTIVNRQGESATVNDGIWRRGTRQLTPATQSYSAARTGQSKRNES